MLGNDMPLFGSPMPAADPDAIAGETNLPLPIRRLALATDLAGPRPVHYGAGRSFAIEVGVRSGARLTRRPVAAGQLVVADLKDWTYQPQRGTVAVDPVLGRLAFPTDRPPPAVWVSHHYGFSSDIGAGEYPRRLSRPGAGTFYAAVRKSGRRGSGELDSVDAALRRWDDVRAEQPTAVIEILDSEEYTEQLDIALHRGERLEIRAANRTRPLLRLLDRLRNAADALMIRTDEPDADADPDPDDDPGAAVPVRPPGGCVRLDGLLISGRAVHVEGPVQRVELVGCTLVPGWGLHADCSPRRPAEPSLELYRTQALVRVERSILGSIEVVGEDDADPVRIELSDSILDATADRREALGAPGRPAARAEVRFRNCTVIGTVTVQSLPLAENTIFTGTVRVGRRQVGCVRYCAVPPGSRTPRRYRCQPELAVAAGTAEDADRVRPAFVSTRFGDPGYARLRLDCADEIVTGADDESELGAFHDLYQPQRLAALRARVAEFGPARSDIAVLPQN